MEVIPGPGLMEVLALFGPLAILVSPLVTPVAAFFVLFGFAY